MLYQMHAWQKQMAQPLRIASETLHNIYTHPMNPFAYTQAGRALAATCEMLERMTRHFAKPAFNLPFTTIDGREIAVTEEVVERRTFCQLRHFKRDIDRKDPKVLLVAPMSGHFATLLRNTVATLLQDHDVYITDWRNARSGSCASALESAPNMGGSVVPRYNPKGKPQGGLGHKPSLLGFALGEFSGSVVSLRNVRN